LLDPRAISQRHLIVIAHGIKAKHIIDLPQIAEAFGSLGGFARLHQAGHQQADENRDDADDDEQFDKRKTV
jgi:hypothetical protein